MKDRPLEIEIRPARPEEAKKATALIAAAYAPWRARLDDLPDVTDGVAADIAEGPTLVAVLGGTLAGIAISRVEGGVLHLANLAVAPEAGGRGVGSALVRAVEAEARDRGIAMLRLATHVRMEGNVGFYERLGWHVTDRAGNKVLMARHLPSSGEDG